MEANPPESETIVTEPEPEPEADPVTEFKKGKAKREAKRKEVVIKEYVPPAPAAAEPIEVPSAESIADRVLEMLAARQGEEEKAKPKRAPPKKKEPTPPPSPAAAKYFGWC
jgi:hypothetical protein